MKEKHVFRKLLSSFLVFIFFVIVIYNCYSYLNCYAISRRLVLPTEQEFLRIKIYGSTDAFEGTSVSGTFSIIDSNGNEIALIERSWSGSYLAVEFSQCNFSGRTYLFPYRIYGKERIIENRTNHSKGTLLEKYYDENGQCLLLGYGSTYKQRHQLYQLARFATRKLPVFDFGTTNSYTIDLSPCETEVYYSIKTDIYGNLKIEKL